MSAPQATIQYGGRSRGSFAGMVAGILVGAIIGFIVYWSGVILLSYRLLIVAPHETMLAIGEAMRNTYTYWELCIVAAGSVIGYITGMYGWRGAGRLAYLGILAVIAGFLSYALLVSLPQVTGDQIWLSRALLLAEGMGLILIFVFSFFTLDATMRTHWQRRPSECPYDPALRPKVAIQIPLYNEPVEVVEETIRHAVEQDYPRDRFVVVVADDSTDETIRAQTKAVCERLGARHFVRPGREGFKAGALNRATEALEDDIELLAVVDADYWVRPDFLSSLVGYFTDPALSFVQTPQDYRNKNESFLTKWYHRAEAFFYHGIMQSRNEASTIIFCGTMGIIRRSAMEDVGGFAEDQICEDAELSVRLAANGWRSLYVAESFGKGLVPAVFEVYKKQFYRWAFGNVRILLSRTGTILRSRMGWRQKFDYMVTNLHWFDGLVILTISLTLLAMSVAPFFGHEIATHHQHEVILLGFVPIVLLFESVFRLRSLIQHRHHISIGHALLVMGMWFSIKMTTARAVLACLLGAKTPFIRTPKNNNQSMGRFRSMARAVRLTRVETFMALALVTVGAAHVHPMTAVFPPLQAGLLALWLSLYALFFATAPIYAYLSYRTLGKDNGVEPDAEPAIMSAFQPQDAPRAVRFQVVDER